MDKLWTRPEGKNICMKVQNYELRIVGVSVSAPTCRITLPELSLRLPPVERMYFFLCFVPFPRFCNMKKTKIAVFLSSKNTHKAKSRPCA